MHINIYTQELSKQKSCKISTNTPYSATHIRFCKVSGSASYPHDVFIAIFLLRQNLHRVSGRTWNIFGLQKNIFFYEQDKSNGKTVSQPKNQNKVKIFGIADNQRYHKYEYG